MRNFEPEKVVIPECCSLGCLEGAYHKELKICYRCFKAARQKEVKRINEESKITFDFFRAIERWIDTIERKKAVEKLRRRGIRLPMAQKWEQPPQYETLIQIEQLITKIKNQ